MPTETKIAELSARRAEFVARGLELARRGRLQLALCCDDVVRSIDHQLLFVGVNQTGRQLAPVASPWTPARIEQLELRQLAGGVR